jgi:hypothetical protein
LYKKEQKKIKFSFFLHNEQFYTYIFAIKQTVALIRVSTDGCGLTLSKERERDGQRRWWD